MVGRDAVSDVTEGQHSVAAVGGRHATPGATAWTAGWTAVVTGCVGTISQHSSAHETSAHAQMPATTSTVETTSMTVVVARRSSAVLRDSTECFSPGL